MGHEDPSDGSQSFVAVEEFEVSSELLDTVDLSPALDLNSDRLSCSIATRAEIVLPVWHEGEFVGELDIDSHTIDPFTSDDEELLAEVVAICAPLVSSILAHIRPG